MSVLAVCLSLFLFAPPATAFKQLEPGLHLGEFESGQKSKVGDSTVRVLRIDPKHFELRLVSVKAVKGQKNKTAKKWAADHNLVAAINASMFQMDHQTSVALMRSGSFINNSALTADNTVLAFDAKSGDVPVVQIIDRTCQDFDALRKKYDGLVQNIRMVNCQGKNVWAQQKRRWSTAAVGIDTSGRVLFIHARSPYSTHDFINILKKLPIDLKNAMYVEGGPEATLYFKSGKIEREYVGSFETGFNENDDNKDAWPIPNVIGAVRKTPPQ